jgi:2,3-bisphosphoglycerate-independent phosphoglycerate mutase
VPVAFEPEKITTTLGSVLADAGKTQLRIGETEKYPHITYFFNGYREEPYPNEYRVLIPSHNTPHPEEHPEMRAKEIADRTIQAIEERSFDFVFLNFANPDIIAHTGDIDAARKAVEIIDEQIGRIGKSVVDNNAILIITSDHGNIERVLEPETGVPQTRHDPSPVPVYLVAQEHYAEKSAAQADAAEARPVGILSDVAPTILALLGTPKPTEMTGENLIGLLT